MRCQPPKKNVLFFLIPASPEPAVLIAAQIVLLGGEKALRVELGDRGGYSNAPPWKEFVPERVTTLTTAPALLPCDAL